MPQISPSTSLTEPVPRIIRPGRPPKSNGHLDSQSHQSLVTNQSVTVTPPMPDGLLKGVWSPQATKVLEERYLLKDDTGKVVETPDQMSWRVSWDIACAEANFGKPYEKVMSIAKEYYRLLVTHEFLPNSPTLANAGKNNDLQYSACYVIPVPDSIEGIFDGIKYQALIHKSGGGTGFAFSRLRSSHSIVGSTKGVASGPISFMKIYDAATEQVKQGGMRRGANMGILRVDHPDVLDFIHAKDSGGITNFNISVAATDTFLKAYYDGTEYDLVDPKTKKIVGSLSAQKVMDEIAACAWKTGDPGMIFLDRINESPANPVPSLGPVEATNPCGEQPLYSFDACNLGSIFLTYFVKETSDGTKLVDWEKLEKVAKLAVRFLDSVIERNPFPLPQIRETVTAIRRIGLGVGGWADMLAQLGMPYDSPEALTLAEKVMSFINEKGHEASEELATEHGPFPLFPESIYKDTKPLRNSTVTTIAPTGTIGIIADASTGIEPFFAIAFKHHVKTNAFERTMSFFNRSFEKVAVGQPWYTQEVKNKIAQEGSLAHVAEVPADIKRIFRTAHDISWDWHVKIQAAFQKYTDNAVSKTINLPHGATREDVKAAYLAAYKSGCRGITVYRDGSKQIQVLNTGTKDKTLVELQPRPDRVDGATYRIETPIGTAFITVNQDDTGNPFEVFINIGKAGSEVQALAEALGRLVSTTLRFGNHLPARQRACEIVDQLKGIGGTNSIGLGSNRVRSLPDAVARALTIHFNLNGGGSQPTMANSNKSYPVPRDLCPSCGAATFIFEEGCSKCYSCGYSKC